MDNSDFLTIDPQDRDLAIRTMIGEEPTPQGQSAVASVILNRAQSGEYGGSSLSKVVLAPGEFEPWSKGGKNLMAISPDDPRYQKAAAIFDGVASGKIPDPTGGATHFFAPKAQAALGRNPPSWAQGQGLSIGQSMFYAPDGKVSYRPPMAQKTAEIDPFSEYETATPKSAPAAASAAPAAAQPAAAAEADPFSEYETAKPHTGPYRRPDGSMYWNPPPGAYEKDYPQAAKSDLPAAPAAPPSSPIGANDTVRAMATGVPIVGGLLNKMDAATNATLAPIGNAVFAPQDQLKGDTWSERYKNALQQQEGMDTSFATEHPVANTVDQLAGGLAAGIATGRAAPDLFGMGEASLPAKFIMGGASGGIINATDAAIRSGGDWNAIKNGGIVGTVLGLGGVGAQEAIGAGVNALSNMLSRTSPAARKMTEILAADGYTPAQAQAKLAGMGPGATIADLGPNSQAYASGLAAMGDEPTSIIKGAYAARAATADDRMAQTVNETLGPKPDAQKILADIRTREGANTVDANTAKAALNDTMGTPQDPHTVLQTMMKARSAAAQPLYEKALSQPIVWTDRLQQFVDDPLFQPSLAKGLRIQRLESLASGEKFNPTDYAVTGFNEAGDPIIGNVPNMRTLNVVKKGLDAMVQDDKNANMGRLSEEGRAIDGVRRSFLSELDSTNDDYKAARQAWAGPTQTQEAFNKGLTIFSNKSGPSGVNSTPGALTSWLETASDGEKEAAKLGARSAFQQEMASASDPASKAAALANKEVNQQKLAAILGPDEAKNLADRLSFKYEDPVGQAFEKGMSVFKQREGVTGIEDTPDALKAWMKTASPAEIEAHQQGARQAIEQALTSARQGDVSQARSLFAKSTANREKLDAIFPNAKKMLDKLDAQLQMRSTEQKVTQGSDTAIRAAVQKTLNPQAAPSPAGTALTIAGALTGGPGGAAAGNAISHVWNSMRNAFSESGRRAMNSGLAERLSAIGDIQHQFMREISRAARIHGPANAIADTLSRGTNLAVRTPVDYARNALWNSQLLPGSAQ